MKNYIFILIVFLSGSLLNKSYSQTDSLPFKTNPNYIQQMGLYEIYNTKDAEIVMLGNSITHGINWNELLGRDGVVERGISSDVIEGFRSRLKYVFNVEPEVCFIMGGINDIYNWIPVEDVFASYINLVKEIQAKNIRVVIQSTLYVSPLWNNAENRNAEVEKLNKLLSGYASKNNIIFIDLNSKMSARKMLNDNLTYDGVHLNGKGYKIWGEEIGKVLKKMGM